MRIHALLAAAIAASPTLAQNLTLDKVGGGLGTLTTFPVAGNANEPYIVLFDLIEQQTQIPALGITLAISDQFAWFSYNAPTFFGMTDGNGEATAQFTLPNDESLEPCVFSCQAVAGFGPWRVSNLVRVTPQRANTFRPALEAPAVPIAGGGVVPGPDASVLFIGGSGPVAQSYASRTEQWQLAGTTFGVGLLSQTTPLPDGRVLFTGGLDLTTGQPTDAAAVYDPIAQTTTTLTMSGPRAGHGASLDASGRVLITGGLSAFDLTNPLSLFTGMLGTTELFDPATGSFVNGPNMLEARALHTSTTLANGEVLIAGGLSVLPIIAIPTVSSTAYRWNPNSQSFGFPSLFSGGRLLHSAVALDNGKVLLVGGLSLDLTLFLQTGNIADIAIGTRDDCQVYTAGGFGTGTFATVNGMQIGRAGAGLAALPNGRALIAGGFQLTIDLATQTFVANATAAADVFSQSPNAIQPAGDMAAARLFPVTAQLPDGTVLVVGGGPGTAEVFQR